MTRQIELKHPDKFYIGGEWVEPATVETFEVLDSATEKVVVRVAKASSEDVERAVAAARKAFDFGPWSNMTAHERCGYLLRLAEGMEAAKDQFARAWSMETGIVHKEAQARVDHFIGGAFRHFVDVGSAFSFSEERLSAVGSRAFKVYEPVGVVAEIISWNEAAALLVFKTAPALVAGCTVVIKSSPVAPTAAYMFAQVCEDVGLPAGVINVLTADREVSEGLVRHPDVDMITFTGSTGAGQRIGALAAERIARVTLELGGKSPALILDDYDIEEAADKLGKSFFKYNAGQICYGLSRVIVPRAKHDRMVEALSAIARKITVGDPFDEGTVSGPLATARQCDAVGRFVSNGLLEGATLAAGGRRPAHLRRGYYFEPTVFANVDNNASIAQREIFGPVLSVIPANDEVAAIRIANDTIYGLNAAVFTNDRERALRVARQMNSGTVGHNDGRIDHTLGFGGFKQSGIGREGGIEGLKAFMESKAILMA